MGSVLHCPVLVHIFSAATADFEKRLRWKSDRSRFYGYWRNFQKFWNIQEPVPTTFSWSLATKTALVQLYNSVRGSSIARKSAHELSQRSYAAFENIIKAGRSFLAVHSLESLKQLNQTRFFANEMETFGSGPTFSNMRCNVKTCATASNFSLYKYYLW